MNVCKIIDSYRDSNQDYLDYIEDDDFAIFSIADGAGGMSNGYNAAEKFVKNSLQNIANSSDIRNQITFYQCFLDIDQSIYSDPDCGECTGVVFVLSKSKSKVWGCSVGDSEVVIKTTTDFQALTCNQVRKPMMGSSISNPVFFEYEFRDSLQILAGSDGLFKYVSKDTMKQAMAENSIAQYKAEKLKELAKLQNGKYQDDICFFLIDSC